MLIPSTDIAVGLRRAKQQQRSRIPFVPSLYLVVFAVGVVSFLLFWA